MAIRGDRGWPCQPNVLLQSPFRTCDHRSTSHSKCQVLMRLFFWDRPIYFLSLPFPSFPALSCTARDARRCKKMHPGQRVLLQTLQKHYRNITELLQNGPSCSFSVFQCISLHKPSGFGDDLNPLGFLTPCDTLQTEVSLNFIQTS